MELGIIISVCGLALSAATFFVGRVTAGKTSGKQDGQILSDIGYIKSGVDTLRADFKDQSKNIAEIRIEQAKHARDIKSAYERIEALERRMSHYHEGG